MIIWLASYPRSGNTLLRMILKSVFGRETYSKYNDLSDIGADEKTKELVGHKMLDAPWEDTYQKMKQSDLLFFTKTHDYPEDDSMAVYIVRDGRASIVSYLHYLKDFNNIECPLADIIAGYVRFGSWGSHLDAWNPLERPNTFLVKYESLLSDSEKEIKRLSDFLRLTPSGHWKNDFEQFHKINPKFFREGTTKKDQEIKGEDSDLFRLFHGDWMNLLGYDKKDTVSIQVAYHLRGMTSRIYKKFEYSQAECNKINSEKHKLIEERNGFIMENAKLAAEKDNLAGEIERLIADRDRLIADTDRLIAENAKLAAEKDNLAGEIERLIADNARLATENSNLAGKMEVQIGTLKVERDNLIAQRDQLLNSLSWKLTEPLRMVGRFIRGWQ